MKENKELKTAFLGIQYEVIEKMDTDKEVYLVRDHLSGQLLIKKEVQKTQWELSRKLAKISSVHLARIFDTLEEEGKYFVYREYLQGDTLCEILKEQGSLDKKLAIEYLSQLCEALTEIHKYQIIHRDIKPENIIITGDGILKLIDFGNAREYDADKNRDTVLMGTVGYAAPELFGRAQTDETTDLYAAGVLLNVMLTGKFPNETLYQGNRAIRQIILKCIQMEQSRRYISASELRKDLEKGEKRYYLKRFVQGIPGFRPRDKKYRWVIFLVAYPFLFLMIEEITKGVCSIKALDTLPNILWWMAALFFSAILPFILLTNMWDLDTRILRLHHWARRDRMILRIVLAYISVMVLGVMLALYFGMGV